jgi:Na+/phosphate symporter
MTGEFAFVECVMNICLLGTFFLCLQKNWDAKYITELLLGPNNMFLGCEILQHMPHPIHQGTQGLVLP